MTKRPYRAAANTLYNAWRHLRLRRSPGDNAARVILRACLRSLTYQRFNEAMREDYIPDIQAYMDEPSVIFSEFC
jgi:hypothetical protein